MLDARHFVAGGAIVFRDLGFDYYLGTKFVWDYEVGGLVETRHSLSPLGLSEAYAGLCQDFLDGGFEIVANQLADGVSVSSEGPTEKALVEQHGVWRAHSGEGFDRVKVASRVGFLKPVEGDGVWNW